MGGIMGFCDFTHDLTEQAAENNERLLNMREALKKRGGNNNTAWLDVHCGLAATSRGVKKDILLTRCVDGENISLVLDGELYNRAELASQLALTGEDRESDAAVILTGFTRYGAEFISRLNGVYALALWRGGALYLFRDHAGVKPLFYTRTGDRILFASEMKALFAHPGVEARLDRHGLAALLLLGPAREPDSGVFKNIFSLPPGEFLMVRESPTHAPSTHRLCYWDLSYKLHSENEAETIAHVRALLTDAIARQTQVDDSICAFLSGGVDSSVVTAEAAKAFRFEGKKLRTFSFDFVDSEAHFTASAFQPDRDRPWIERMVAYAQTEHEYIECGPEALADLLGDAVAARDLPGMADVDASLLYFCTKMPEGTIALTGECADEVFGGYPWFHREGFEGGFPWSPNAEARKTLLSDDLIHRLDFDNTFDSFYRRALERAGQAAAFEDTEEARLRAVSYMTIKYFMTTLTERMDRMGAYAGMDARVPFADIRLMEYVWNVPWHLKKKNTTAKYLLREAMRGLAPDEILFRKKSPFPKTYDPAYAALVASRVREDVLNDPNAPVRDLIDTDKIRMFMTSPAETGKPWFGQLMAGPQRLAYIWQINFWLKSYGVQIEME